MCSSTTHPKRALIVVIEELQRLIGDPQIPAVGQLEVIFVALRAVHSAIVAAATDSLRNRFTTVTKQVVNSPIVAEPQPNVLGSFVMPAFMAVELNALRRLLDFDVV